MGSQKSMAATGFLRTAWCKKNNRVAQVLAYALLEWILIALLLANGVFSYLISKFAAFFCLAPPCVLCSRLGVDSLFEPRRGRGRAEPLRRVLCDAHAAEVSRLGYCGTHRRLADAGDMCEDCATASGKAPLALSWMRRSELGEKDLACTCCGVALESGFYSPSFLFPRPSSLVLDCGYKREEMGSPWRDEVFVSEDGPVIELFDEKPLLEDDSIGVMAQCTDIVGGDERVVPLESINSVAVCMVGVTSQFGGDGEEEVDHGILDQDAASPDNEVDADEELEVASDHEKVDTVVDWMIGEEIAASVVLPLIIEERFESEVNAVEAGEGVANQQTLEEDTRNNDSFHETSIASEVSEHGWVEQAELKHELVYIAICPMEHATEKLEMNTEEGQSDQSELKQEWDSMSMHARLHAPETCNENTEAKQVELAELKQASDLGILEHVTDPLDAHTDADKEDSEIDPSEATLPSLYQFSPEPAENNLAIIDKLSPEHIDVEDEKAPDTPIHIEGICNLPELSDSKTKNSGTKSVDGSVSAMSTELESSELVTVDQLKSALVAARNSLNALYAELDNERNAAAIAADETMAMINRLQEQKAAMQMEAIQYQRLMEEQSEYDQEALQRLNELVVKREEEKQDLERELELYRHKIHLYEAKERRKMSRHKADDHNGSSSASSSAEDSDDLSPSFYEGDESAHGLNGSNGSTPTDAVLQETARHLVTLDDSLADFEEERLSIQEQLKVLEEKLFDLEDESDNSKTDEHSMEENHLNGASNGFSDEDSNFKVCTKRTNASYAGKALVPQYDDANVDDGNGLQMKLGAEVDSSGEVTLELAKEQDKIAIANEIDHVYERLHALEADREFLKQCMRLLNKGGKGLDLLREILQHLRDRRRIEQHARNSGEFSPHYLHPYTD